MRTKCLYDELSQEEYDKTKKFCKHCGKEYYNAYTKSGRSDFCCLSCSKKYASLVNKEEANRKMKETIKTKISKASNCFANIVKNRNNYYENPNFCAICSIVLPYERRHKKTCCLDCETKLRSKSSMGNPTGNKGGYREGSGRSKSGYYNDVFMGSTYELAYYIYQTDHGKEVIRNERTFEYTLNGKKHSYLPDFVLEGIFIEVKGYHTSAVDVKLQAVKEAGFDIKIFYIEDLLPMMDYIDEHYGTHHCSKENNYHTLYQDYKPKYEYKCDYCGKTFYADKIRKSITGKVYCCRECAGKGKSPNQRKLSRGERKKISEAMRQWHASHRNR